MDFNKLKLDKKRSIEEYFNFFIANCLDIETAMNGINDGNAVFIGDIDFGFSPEINRSWRDFLINILKAKKLINYVSYKTIDKETKKLFKEYLLNNKINLYEKFQQTMSYLEEYKTEIKFHYFYVNGFKSSQIYQFENIKIGNFEGICPLTNISFSEKIRSNFEEIHKYKLKNNSFNSIDEYNKKDLEKLISSLEGNTVLEISNFGDDESSLNQSIHDAESFINELIFLAKNSTNLDFNISLDSKKQENTFPLIVNYDNSRLSSSSEKFEHLVVLDLNKKTNSSIQIGEIFKDLNFPLHSKNNDNKLIEKLKIAINWYSSSIKSQNHRESFLFCAIGMEALLTNGRDSITKTLSENTAFLIASKDIKS
ncbi:hypothetical protein [Acinetobacter sp. YH12140]|uniref:hypothetical protein n=1 Tax=Acinetobacter sp. YH12140 TaxID=2601124 RepID=UPI00211EDF66|nr:hypothetical protein [Acinetobacter sp. YH12140]